MATFQGIIDNILRLLPPLPPKKFYYHGASDDGKWYFIHHDRPDFDSANPQHIQQCAARGESHLIEDLRFKLSIIAGIASSSTSDEHAARRVIHIATAGQDVISDFPATVQKTIEDRIAQEIAKLRAEHRAELEAAMTRLGEIKPASPGEASATQEESAPPKKSAPKAAIEVDPSLVEPRKDFGEQIPAGIQPRKPKIKDGYKRQKKVLDPDATLRRNAECIAFAERNQIVIERDPDGRLRGWWISMIMREIKRERLAKEKEEQETRDLHIAAAAEASVNNVVTG